MPPQKKKKNSNLHLIAKKLYFKRRKKKKKPKEQLITDNHKYFYAKQTLTYYKISIINSLKESISIFTHCIILNQQRNLIQKYKYYELRNQNRITLNFPKQLYP